MRNWRDDMAEKKRCKKRKEKPIFEGYKSVSKQPTHTLTYISKVTVYAKDIE